MDFSERLGQVMHEVWGCDVVGDLGKDGYLEFFPTDMVSEPEVVHYKEGLFAYYEYERGNIGAPVFRSSSLHVMEHCLTLCFGNPLRKRLGFQPLRLVRNLSMRPGWSLVPVDSKPWHGFLAFEKILVFSSRVGRRMMIFLLLFLMLLSIRLWTCWSVICVLMLVRS